jgi:hypothetical protein
LKKHALLALALLGAACGGQSEEALIRETAAWREERDQLRNRLAQATAGDPVVREALARQGSVGLALRPRAAEEILLEASRLYLDRVVLDLALEKRVSEEGTLRVGTFFGKMKAGEWTVEATVHRVKGVLRAERPILRPRSPDAVTFDVPVVLQAGQGDATIRFEWDAKSVANVICRDFEMEGRLAGRALADAYRLKGAFALRAGPDSLTAIPEMSPTPFRIRVDLTAESWRDVEKAIALQDKLLRCGLALDPDSVRVRLKDLLSRGFAVKLPRSLLRPVSFPAGVVRTVTIGGQTRKVAVATSDFELTPEALWYSAAVAVE